MPLQAGTQGGVGAVPTYSEYSLPVLGVLTPSPYSTYSTGKSTSPVAQLSNQSKFGVNEACLRAEVGQSGLLPPSGNTDRRKKGTGNRNKGTDKRNKGKNSRNKGTDNRNKGTDNRNKGTNNRTSGTHGRLHLSDYAPSGTNRSIGTRAQRSLGGHQRAPRRAADVALCSSCRPSHVYYGARRTFTMLHVARLEWSTLHVGTAGRRQSAVLLPRARARAHAHAALRAPVGSGSDHLPRLSAWLAPPAPAPATGLGPPRPTSGPGLALQGTTRGRRTSSGSRRTAASRRTRAGPRARRRVSTRVPRASFPARRALERPSHRPRLARFHPSLARSLAEGGASAAMVRNRCGGMESIAGHLRVQRDAAGAGGDCPRAVARQARAADGSGAVI